RLLPRRNEEVNQVWMCDEGRLTYHATNDKRVEWARTGEGDSAASVRPRIAVDRVVEPLKPLAGRGGIGVAGPAQCTNEEAHVALPCKGVEEQGGSPINWYGGLRRPWESVPAQRGGAAPGWSWAGGILIGLGGAGLESVAAAFRALTEKSPHLGGLWFDEL